MSAFSKLLAEIARCTICAEHLPHGPRPVLRAHPDARVLVVGQAPGRRVHESGIPFDDPSGVRLREWMGIDADVFYDEKQVAIVPMGFCYPGTGKSGDLPPRPECVEAWRAQVLDGLPRIEVTGVLGQYAHAYHLKRDGRNLTERVKAWREFWPTMLPLPHPSPRNLGWFKKNPWFAEQVLPLLKSRISELLES